MDFVNQIIILIFSSLDFIFSIKIMMLTIILIFAYHIILIFIRDKNYIKTIKKYKDPDEISIDDLNEFPLVNIIVPSWNEGENFNKSLISITELKYPKLNVIVNAGGSEDTINIANSFKKYNNFRIIYQKSGGKIKALNECLNYVTEGVLYLVDADVFITDETLIRMLIPIVNYRENVVIGGARPLKSQENKDIVKYLQVVRNLSFRFKFSRYNEKMISGANTIITYDAMKRVGKFSHNTIYSVEESQAFDIISKGLKIYRLNDYRGKIFTKVPDTIKLWIKQKIRWNENSIIYAYEHKKIYLIKFLILLIFSIYLLIFPILVIFHIAFLITGLYFLLFKYLKKIRMIIFYKKCNKSFIEAFGIIFFLKILFYIYLEAIVYIYITLEMVFYGNKKLLKRKNL